MLFFALSYRCAAVNKGRTPGGCVHGVACIYEICKGRAEDFNVIRKLKPVDNFESTSDGFMEKIRSQNTGGMAAP